MQVGAAALTVDRTAAKRPSNMQQRNMRVTVGWSMLARHMNRISEVRAQAFVIPGRTMDTDPGSVYKLLRD